MTYSLMSINFQKARYIEIFILLKPLDSFWVPNSCIFSNLNIKRKSDFDFFNLEIYFVENPNFNSGQRYTVLRWHNFYY